MLDCRNATSVDNNKSICLSEVRIPRSQLRTGFNKKMCRYKINRTATNNRIYTANTGALGVSRSSEVRAVDGSSA